MLTYLVIFVLFGIVIAVGPDVPKLDLVKECFLAKKLSSISNLNSVAINANNYHHFVTLDRVFSDQIIHNLELLSNCMKVHSPEYFRSRLFPQTAQKQSKIDGYLSGNNVTYMNGYLFQLYPEFVTYVRQISNKAAYALPDPMDCMKLGVRGMEYIEYEAGNRLGLHRDKASVYTLVVVLTDSSKDFVGGNFLIEPTLNWNGRKKDVIPLNLSLNSGIVFYSEYRHGIDVITSGNRRIFTVEWWNYPNARPINSRPLPDEPRLFHKAKIARFREPVEDTDEIEGIDINVDGTTTLRLESYTPVPDKEECISLVGEELYASTAAPIDPSMGSIVMNILLPYQGSLYCGAFPESSNIVISKDHILCMNTRTAIKSSTVNTTIVIPNIELNVYHTIHCIVVESDEHHEVIDVVQVDSVRVVSNVNTTSKGNNVHGASWNQLYSAESHQLYFIDMVSLPNNVAVIDIRPVSNAGLQVTEIQHRQNCYATDVLIYGHPYIVKQKVKEIYQFRVVADALAAYIAGDLKIAHKVEIISASTYIPGKVRYDWPAVVVTTMPGMAIRDRQVGLYDYSLDIEQGYQKAEDEQGLQIGTIESMALHPDLAVIVGLDIMIGNRDRHRGNLFYDVATDSFYAIDMDDSFELDLAMIAVINMCRIMNEHTLSEEELVALDIMRQTIVTLLERYRTNHLISMLDYFAMKSGFVRGSEYYSQDIEQQLGDYATVIADTWVNARKLVIILNNLLDGTHENEKMDICTPYLW